MVAVLCFLFPSYLFTLKLKLTGFCVCVCVRAPFFKTDPETLTEQLLFGLEHCEAEPLVKSILNSVSF